MDVLLLVRFNFRGSLTIYRSAANLSVYDYVHFLSDTRISQLESYILAPPTLRLEFNKFLNVSEHVLAANFLVF